ncbi:MAG: FlgD immunoglobulin-like domain containing protein [bacterium]
MSPTNLFRVSVAALCLLGLALGFATAGAAPPPGAQPTDATTKVYVTDGSMVHNVGELWLNITNWGLIGSHPSATTTYSHAPSARWPGASGVNHLWGGGLWVGGVMLGERLVSTGQFAAEIRAEEGPEDTIYETSHGAPGGNRYPWPDADDDGDGAEDEDPLDGYDNDGDSLIDEDFAAIGDQHLECVMYDNTGDAQEMYPDHTPLNLKITQQSFQWDGAYGSDFVCFDFTVRNIGVSDLQNVYMGFFVDADIPAISSSAEDDMFGSWCGSVPIRDGDPIWIDMGYMYDGNTSPQGGYLGAVLLGHTTDATGTTAPTAVGLNGIQRLEAQQPFSAGGDPTNDAERYQLLSEIMIDPASAVPADYRYLISVGPFPDLDPEAEITFQMALVAGANLDELIANATEAAVIYHGAFYDRDNDPGTGVNGKEYQVHWLHPDNTPVGVERTELAATAAGESARLEIITSFADFNRFRLVRECPNGEKTRIWSGRDFGAGRPHERGLSTTLVDDEPVGWPRIYTLLFQGAFRESVVERLELDNDRAYDLRLNASPNPFNPQVEIRFWLAEPGPAELAIYDLAGRCIRTLHTGDGAAGEKRYIWNGCDEAGRAVASGVYNIRLQTRSGQVRKTLTLVR